MKVLISVDMEGITGVVSQSHTDHTTAEYQRFRKLMTGDANAAIEGALAGGATDVVVNDSHGNMDNILVEDLNPAARLISGSPKPFSMMQGIGSDVGTVFFIGYHARAGSAPAVHDHTWASSTIYHATLNGQPMGEIMLNAALAGHFGVTVALVTGDQLATAEAREVLGDVETVTVKIAVGRNAADCLPPAKTGPIIRQAAQQAVQNAQERKRAPFTVKSPILLGIEFLRSTQVERAELMPGARRTGPRSIEWEGSDMVSVYRTWRAFVYLAGSP
jgi:D-amino peptidase